MQTKLSQFRSQELEVRRRFSDFLGLHEKLVAKHLPEGRIVPPAPEKSIIGSLFLFVHNVIFTYFVQVTSDSC